MDTHRDIEYRNVNSIGCSCGCGKHCGHSCMTDDCDCNECRCPECMKDVYNTPHNLNTHSHLHRNR